MGRTASEKTDLEWVKGKLREFIDSYDEDDIDPALILDALKTLGGLLVKSEPKRSQDAAPPGFLAHNPIDGESPTE